MGPRFKYEKYVLETSGKTGGHNLELGDGSSYDVIKATKMRLKLAWTPPAFKSFFFLKKTLEDANESNFWRPEQAFPCLRQRHQMIP